jgi:DNA-directed RNA polymerase alpha subunit
MKFDINKVICISLKSHNDQQLKAISEVYKLDFNALVTVKGTSAKIWVEAGGDYVIAFVNSVGDTTVNSIFCPITKKEKDALLKITPIKTPKMPKATKVVEEVDESFLQMRKILKTALADLDLSVRAYNCLKAAEIKTLGELVNYHIDDLLKFRNFGKKSLSELEEFVREKGLHFGMEVAKYNINDE